MSAGSWDGKSVTLSLGLVSHRNDSLEYDLSGITVMENSRQVRLDDAHFVDDRWWGQHPPILVSSDSLQVGVSFERKNNKEKGEIVIDLGSLRLNGKEVVSLGQVTIHPADYRKVKYKIVLGNPFKERWP